MTITVPVEQLEGWRLNRVYEHVFGFGESKSATERFMRAHLITKIGHAFTIPPELAHLWEASK